MIWFITTLGLVLRLINLNQSLWLDEASQTTLSQMPIREIFFGRLGDVHPPLSFIFYHFWMMVSTNDLWVRLLPVIFGVATILVIYTLVKEMINKKTATLSALLIAIAPFHIYYSQEIRMYSMLTFFTSLSIYFLYKQKWWLYIFSSAALIYTHHIGFLVIVSQLLYVIFRRQHVWKFIKYALVILLLWLPWLPVFLNQLKNGANPDQYLSGWSSLLSLPLVKAIPETFIKFSIGRISFDNKYFYGSVAILVAAVFVYLIYIGIRHLKKENYLLVFWLFGPVLLGILISLRLPLFEPQRMIVVLPVFYIFISYGILNLKKFSKIALVAVFIISITSLAIYYQNPKFSREDWKGATYYISHCQADCDVLFIWPQPFDPYIWYGGFSGKGLIKSFPAGKEELTKNIDTSKKYHYLFEYLQDLTDPSRLTQQVLVNNGYFLSEQIGFRGVGFVDLYQKK